MSQLLIVGKWVCKYKYINTHYNRETNNYWNCFNNCIKMLAKEFINAKNT